MARGGARLGAGQKKRAPITLVPRSVQERELHEAPDDLPAGQVGHWHRLAPAAVALGTLTPETQGGFRHLCEVAERCDRLQARITRTAGPRSR